MTTVLGEAMVLLACGAISSSVLGAEAPHGARTPPDVQRLVRRFDELYESSGTVARAEIAITKGSTTRTLRLKTWSKGRDKALILVEAPPRDAGTATLKIGNNLWNYLPKIARTIRVPPSMMLSSWMGSDLTNDDLARESSYEHDYESEVVGESGDPPGWLVVSRAKPGIVGLWSRVEVVFSFDELLPVEVRFFDRRDRLARTMRFDDVRTMGGRRVPVHITVIPATEAGRRTELRYLEVTFDVEVPDETFSLSELERRR